MLSELRVSFGPHVRRSLSTRRVMLDVLIGLAPALAAAGYFFRVHAVVLVSVCVMTALVTEWICNWIRGRSALLESLTDLSSVVTAVILALSLPPALPWWAAMIGTAFAVGVGKMAFGGLGSNIFNPAMVGRTFLTASFGALMTTWTVPATLDPNMPAISAAQVDARTQATPLAWAKQARKLRISSPRASRSAASEVDRSIRSALLGEEGGCLGETSALVLILGGVYLLVRGTIGFIIPTAVLLGAMAFSGAAYAMNPQASILPWSHVLSGGLLLCAFFIATDPVTCPLTPLGQWIFGIGVGVLTLLIRVVGEYPEGVMYAVLLMNACTPMIDRYCTLVPAGGRPHVQA